MVKKILHGKIILSPFIEIEWLVFLSPITPFCFLFIVPETSVAIEIVDSLHLNPNEIMQIKDCVELVFNDLYLLKEQKNLIKQRQTYLEAQLGKASNVIPFRVRELH
jgi:hypothetical protein